MKLTEIVASKQLKIGLPNYSNITVGLDMKFEVKEGEVVSWDKIWDVINQQLQIQAEAGTDQSWIHRDETKYNYKTTVRIPKTDTQKGPLL